jgi:hypothetical protein
MLCQANLLAPLISGLELVLSTDIAEIGGVLLGRDHVAPILGTEPDPAISRGTQRRPELSD